VPARASGQGVLAVNAVPWGTVVVNGVALAETPLAVDLPAGRYRVRVSHDTHGSDERVVEVVAGRRTRINATYRTR
jgi:hypothetical protein